MLMYGSTWKRSDTFRKWTPRSCLLAGSLYGLFFQSADKGQTFNGEPPLTSIGEIMRASIISSIKAILSVGGYMLLFGVIIALADDFGLLKGFAGGLAAGIMEMTNGISRLSALGLPIEKLIPLCSLLLSFSGLSICRSEEHTSELQSH